MTSNRHNPLRLAGILASAAALGILGAAGPAAASATETRAATSGATTYPAAAVILPIRAAVHARPSSSSRIVTVSPQFRRDYRPTTLLALSESRDSKGIRWLKLSLPTRPNGSTGWIRARSVQLRPIARTVVIDLSARKLRVLERGRTRFATRVAIGRRGMETPRGLFYITATFCLAAESSDSTERRSPRC